MQILMQKEFSLSSNFFRYLWYRGTTGAMNGDRFIASDVRDQLQLQMDIKLPHAQTLPLIVSL